MVPSIHNMLSCFDAVIQPRHPETSKATLPAPSTARFSGSNTLLEARSQWRPHTLKVPCYKSASVPNPTRIAIGRDFIRPFTLNRCPTLRPSLPLFRTVALAKGAQKSIYRGPNHLWVKQDGAVQPIFIPTGNCQIVAQVIKEVKKELVRLANVDVDQITLFTPQGEDPLCPSTRVADIPLQQGYVDNDARHPLVAKINPPPPPPPLKYITILQEDEYGKDRKLVVGLALSAFQKIDKRKKSLQRVKDHAIMSSFADITEGDAYRYFPDFPGSSKFEDWIKNEANAMEAEVTLTVKKYLLEHLGVVGEALPTVLRDGGHRQEWDGILQCGETLYLIEAKHSMSLSLIDELTAKICDFNILKHKLSPVYHVPDEKVVGVAAVTWFPDSVQEVARAKGLLCVCLSGDRCNAGEGSNL